MMQWLRGFGILGLLSMGAVAQLQPGDVAFVGWNADGADDIAFVTFKDIPANDTLRFCDSEWNGTGFGTDEGDFSWVSGAPVPAGTVVVINNLGSGTTTASTGSIPAALDNSGGMSTTGEAQFLFKGTGPRMATTVLAAIANDTAAFATTANLAGLAGSGLTKGTTAIALTATADVGNYNGPRTGLNQAGYLAALNNLANWQLQDSSGSRDDSDGVVPNLPFNTTAFNIAPGVTPVTPALSFDKTFYSVKENSGSLSVRINASAAPSDTATVQIQIIAGGTAAAGTDFTFANQTFTWPKDSAGFRTFSIPLINNATAQPDRFFVLELKSPVKATLGTNTRLAVYILDDDTQAPARSSELGLKFVSSFKVDSTSGASAEIVAHDPKSKRLFVMNSTRDRLEILNFRNPRTISKISTIDLLTYGSGGTSVAVRNGLVAVTMDAANFAPGKVVLLDTNGVVLKSLTVGSLPDMVGFSPDGKYVLTANEGQPSADYLTDPEGSISIIDMTGGIDSVSQARVTTVGFTSFNGQEATLRAGGGRIFGLNATVAKDMEPEYITVSDDSKTAWVTLQENNIIAKLDLQTKAFTQLFPLGYKNHNLARNALDASDQSDSVFMGTWPVKGVYMPDGIASLKLGDTTYLFTANEGDAREYTALTEEIRVGAAGYVLDSVIFPNAALLKMPTNLGRLTVSSKTGDLNNDGKFDEIHVLGARSFSVWNGTTGAQVWDSGDELERITASDSAYRSLFNASHDGNARKNRSDNKGPEPEGIAIATIGSKQYAFIALERIGGVVAYEVTNPRAPRFVAYANNRTLGSTQGGDLGSEGIIFISKAQSPNDTALVVLANEISATVSVYSVRDTTPVVVGIHPLQNGGTAREKLKLHRAGLRNLLFFSRPVDFKLADVRGKILRAGKDAPWVDLQGLRPGRYFLSVPGSEAFPLDVLE